MPPSSILSRSKATFDTAAVASTPLFDFLAPSISQHRFIGSRNGHRRSRSTATRREASRETSFEALFFTALSNAATCSLHKPTITSTKGSKGSFCTGKSQFRQFTGAATGQADQPTLLSTFADDDPQERPSAGTLPSNFFNSQAQHFAQGSNLPSAFYDDVQRLQRMMAGQNTQQDGGGHSERHTVTLGQNKTSNTYTDVERVAHIMERNNQQSTGGSASQSNLLQQVDLLRSVRELEEKLAQANRKLQQSMEARTTTAPKSTSEDGKDALTLSKDDYLGLVDLYFYTHQKRFGPESTDSSPTPTFLEDYSFKLSQDFARPQVSANDGAQEEDPEPPLKGVEKTFKVNQLREIRTMQAFIDLLLDDQSSSMKLYDAYKLLPSPGVAFLPKGVIRLFLQRMATPWVKSEGATLRYLSLIDDMQQAKLPLTSGEWSSAIYLAARGFGPITSENISSAFLIWRQMEIEAGVKSSHVTFNILFDITVRAGRYALASTLLKEMYDRGLRLNRLGRVSLAYYHGLRGDGDAVRKTYRDFVEVGETVDTLVLNCIIASLFNAQEPSAAEQIYERMKDIQKRFVRGRRADGSELLYRRYPPPGDVHIDRQMASNHLGRVLLRASHLKNTLPDHHTALQASTPLTPDYITFRAMISHHANVSGDLDRITVLVNEMTQLFKLPLTDIFFQLLFKGFALHTEMRDPDCTWNFKRLEQTWDACRNSIKFAQELKQTRTENGTKLQRWLRAKSKHLALPSVEEFTNVPPTEVDVHSANAAPAEKRLVGGHESVADVGIHPHEHTKPVEKVHSQDFDEGGSLSTIEGTEFENPFFQRSPMPPDRGEAYYLLGKSEADHEEGGYSLPNPAEAIAPNSAAVDKKGPSQQKKKKEMPRPQNPSSEFGEVIAQNVYSSSQAYPERDPYEIRLTRPLVCWLLRAYGRSTGDRSKLQEIWNSVRKLYQPQDEAERQSVVRAFKRCWRDCDR